MRRMNRKTVHFRLAELRRAKKITQQELAEYVGTTYQTISKWETGITMPDVMVLPVLADYFDVSVDELLGLVPLKGEKFLSEKTDSEEFWNQKLEYLLRKGQDSWNKDYLKFLVEQVWKIDKPVHVLDCGCGYGYMGVLLMSFLPESSEYTGIDFSSKLVEQGKKILKENHIKGEIRKQDFLTMEEQEIYDLVICQSVLRHVGDSRPFIKRMLKLAKKGALLVCIDTNRELECAGLYIEGMDYQYLCSHKGADKHWLAEYENGDRDYAAAMRNAYVMQDLGVRDVQVRMNDRVSFVSPLDESYQRKRNGFLEESQAWYEGDGKVIERLVNHGMSRAEAVQYTGKGKAVKIHFANNDQVRYTRFKGKMITFGYK